MAAQDFGSGLLAGFQGASAMAQQRRDEAARDRELTQRDATLAQRKAEFDENVKQFEKTYKISAAQEAREQSKFDIGMSQLAADNTISAAINVGLYNPASGNFSLSTDRLTELLGSKDQTARQLLIDAANRQNPTEGFKFTDYQTAEDGSIVVTGEYEDGSPGVLTEDGSSDPNARVATFTPDQAASLVSDDFINVTNASSILSGQRGVAFLGFSGANSADLAQAQRERTLQANVLSAIDSSGDVGLSRQFRSVLADAGSKEEKISILEDQATSLGIELPKIQTEGELVDYTPTGRLVTAGPPVTDRRGQTSARRVTQARRAGISRLDTNIANLENKLTTAKSDAERDNIQEQLSELDGERRGLVDAENNANLELVTSEISELRSKFDKAAPARKEYWQERLDEKKAAKTQLEEALGLRTQVMGSQEYKNLEEQVFTRLDAMTPDQVDEAVDNGDLTFTPEQVGVMRQRLQESNITSVQQISELPSNEQLAYRALLAVIAPDQTARDQARTEMSNLVETGTLSMSAKEAAELQVDVGTLNTRIAELRRNLRNDEYNTEEDQQTRIDAASTLSTGFIADTNEIFFGEDGSERNLNARSARRYSRQVLPQILTTAARAASPEEAQLFQAALNTGVSLTMAGYAAEEEGGFAESFYSFFRPDSVDVATGTDFDLARVRLDGTPDAPEAFYYVDAGGGRTDERVIATDLQDLDDKVYAIVLDAAKKNSAAARR